MMRETVDTEAVLRHDDSVRMGIYYEDDRYPGRYL